MQLSGKQVLNASPSKVWQILQDPETLTKIIPGVTELERINENLFRSVIGIQLGPVSSSFAGHMQLEDIVEEKSFVLKVQQNSKLGNANAAIKIDLLPVSENQTEVAFDGDVKLSGILASMGNRVLNGVANMLTKQFFNNMEKVISDEVKDSNIKRESSSVK